MSFQQQLQDIDYKLGAMPKQNRTMLMLSVALGIVLGLYYFFGADLAEEALAKSEKAAQLQSKLDNNAISAFEAKIEKEQKKILLLAQVHQEGEFKATALRTKLERMDYLSADAKGMADTLERILKESVTLGVAIDKLTIDNTLSPYEAQIDKRGSILIEGEADFRSVLKLLSFIESQEALLVVDHVKFTLEQKSSVPAFAITITGYGIKL
ncbi:MAG: hypothetical protein IBX43_05865 [Campylobacterales bacterium]|nr:hypothetical protein [Campylobacterales bacterium]